MRTLVLASTSPYRLQLLRQLGLPFQVASPLFTESIDQSVAPELLVKHLSYHKAASLRERYPQALIIGADQVFVDARGRILGKPGDFERAVAQLRDMSGRSHVFYTGVSVVDAATRKSLTDYTTFSVTLRQRGDEESYDYLRGDAPFDCAVYFQQ